jgi:hypothetical protein
MSKFINNAIKKPFCKVCFDAGKPESDYTSHRVRSLPDMNGKTTVTCPVLASTECRYCYNFGHTTKFCTVLEENKKKADKAKSIAIKAQRAAERAAAAHQQATSRKETDLKYAGKFAGLEEEDEQPESEIIEVTVAIKQAEFPTLGQKKEVRFAAVFQSNWAAMAAKPALKPAPVKMNTTVLPSRTWDLEESDSDEDEEMYPALPTKAVEKDEWDDLPIISSSSYSGRALAEDDEW